MNYSNIYWKEKLMNYTTDIAFNKRNISNKKIESIIRLIDGDIDIIYYILITISLFGIMFLNKIMEIENFYVPEIISLLINKPQITFLLTYIISDYTTKYIPFIPTYYLTTYISFSIIIFLKTRN
jgi:hypothetical protein